MDYREFMPLKFNYKGKYVDNGVISNMFYAPFYYFCPIEKRQMRLESVEVLYQKLKLNNTSVIREEVAKYEQLNGYQAKRLTRSYEKKLGITLSELEKLEYMAIALWHGKMTNDHVVQLLNDLYKKYRILVEWSNWGDTTWGVDINTGQGKNYLGKMLTIMLLDRLQDPTFIEKDYLDTNTEAGQTRLKHIVARVLQKDF